MWNTENAIIHYIDHLEEHHYMQSVVESLTAEELFQLLAKMLSGGDGERSRTTMLFIRDLCLMSPPSIRSWFFPALQDSGAMLALEQNLFVPDHFVRSNAVYTLGKIGAVNSLGRLLQVFAQYKERDPLLMPSLLGEIIWLRYSNPWSLIDELIESERSLTRWAAVECMSNGILRDEDKFKRVEKLSVDPNALIRAEAEALLQKCNFRGDLQPISQHGKPQRKPHAQEFRRIDPAITFSGVGIEFRNRLHRMKQCDYNIDELEEFVQRQMERNKSHGIP